MTDAMGPRVVSLHRHTTSTPALNGEQETVIIARTAVVHFRNASEETALRWILQHQNAPLVYIRHGRSAWNVNSGIDLTAAPQVNHIADDIIRCDQPIG